VAGAALGAGIAVAGHGIAHDPTRKAWSWLLFPWLGLMVAMSAWATAGLGSVNTMFFTNADKVIHLIVFGLCGFFTVAWTRPGRPAAVLGGLVGIVLLEEAMQGLWPGRSVDIMDALASTSGVVIFGLLASAMARARAKPIADHLGAGPPPQTD
ncbi:MAG: VanZ family protein, partial [Myxococcota bacterium]